MHANAIAEWTEKLARSGAPVAAPLRSPVGRLVEQVHWDDSLWCVSACAVVEGETYDDEELTPDRAAAWGRVLADVHRTGSSVANPSAGTPTPPPSLAGLPAGPDVVGMLHGDPEPDNVVWPADADAPVLVDLDDAAMGWFAADVAFALRAWSPPAGAPPLDHPIVAAFVAGYRDIRPLTDAELGWLPLFARWQAETQLSRLVPVAAESPDESWPQWAHDLAEKIRRLMAELSHALLA